MGGCVVGWLAMVRQTDFQLLKFLDHGKCCTFKNFSELSKMDLDIINYYKKKKTGIPFFLSITNDTIDIPHISRDLDS